MDAVEHIDKAAKAIADMVEHGHLKTDIVLAAKITGAQYELQEARALAVAADEESEGVANGT